MTAQLLAPLHPDQFALTSLFQANVDESMLREIAEADYGNEAEKCHALLQQIWKTGLVESDDFMLTEVLALTRWSEPDIPDSGDTMQGLRGHWIRLFACTALLQRAQKYPHLDSCNEEDTLAQFLVSAVVLGKPVAQSAASMLAGRFLTYPGKYGEPPFLAFAILLLAAHVEHREARGAWLQGLTAWVEEEEINARWEVWAQGPEWLFGLHLVPLLKDAAWRSLAHRILTSPESPHPSAADQSLRRLGTLCGPSHATYRV